MKLGNMLGDEASKKLKDEMRRREKEEIRKKRAREIARAHRLGRTIRYQKNADED